MTKGIYSRFSDVFLAIFEVSSEAHGFGSCSIGLSSHKDKCGFENVVGHLFIVSAHALPEVIDDHLDRDGAIWQDIAAADRDQLFVVSRPIFQGHVVKEV